MPLFTHLIFRERKTVFTLSKGVYSMSLSNQRFLHLSFSSFFLCIYVSYGAFYPLLSIYLKELHFTGTQMGIIMSISPLMMLIVQPLWGIICDYTKQLRLILIGCLFLSALICYFFTLSAHFAFLITIAILLSFFQSAVNPISDSIVISYTSKHHLDYGRFRMWGALGFAGGAWVMGILAKDYGTVIIFYTYSIFFLLSILFVIRFPKEQIVMRTSVKQGLRKLLHIPRFFIFLISVFCILGPMLSNNSFFGPYFQTIGGTVAGIGFCFFLGAGSEVPFMKWVGKWMKQYGILVMCISAGCVSGLQYLLFTFHPPIEWVYVLSLTQGFSIGVFIPASLQYVQQIAPKEVQTTAIATYSSAAYGLGNWFFVFIGGILMDQYHVFSIYLFYSVMTFVGVVLLCYILLSKRSNTSSL